MTPALYESTALTFTTQGIGALSDAISCEVEENRNGAYELTMEYPITGKHYSDIDRRRIILAKPNFIDDPQPFRIYKIEHVIEGVATVYAQHVSYDLGDFACVPFEATGLTQAMLGLKNNLIDSTDPRIAAIALDSDIYNTTTPFKVDVPSPMRSWFGGQSGSLVDLYGGEWSYDGWSCYLHNARGANRGVTIRYAKNLTKLDHEITTTNVYTHMLGYWKNDNADTTAGELALVQSDLTAILPNANYKRILTYDFTEKFEEQPTVADLNQACLDYIASKNMATPKENITLDFVQLDKLQQRVDLCDTVTVVYDALGVSATSMCIRTVWDVLKNRYSECEFGEARNSIAGTIVSTHDEIKELKKSDSAFQTALDVLTEEIANAQGFYITSVTQDDGSTIMYMHEKQTLAESSIVMKVTAETVSWSTDGGTTWNAVVDAEGRALFQHLYTVGINANYITTGLIQGASDTNWWNLDTGELHIANGTIDITTTSENTDKIVLRYGNYQLFLSPSVVQVYNSQTGDRSYMYPGLVGAQKYVAGQTLPRAILSNSQNERGLLSLYDEMTIRRLWFGANAGGKQYASDGTTQNWGFNENGYMHASSQAGSYGPVPVLCQKSVTGTYYPNGLIATGLDLGAHQLVIGAYKSSRVQGYVVKPVCSFGTGSHDLYGSWFLAVEDYQGNRITGTSTSDVLAVVVVYLEY